MYYSFASHADDYLPLYMPAQGTCQQIIDAQLVHTDMTYRIEDWYYMPAYTTGIDIRVSVTDLALFVSHAFDVGVWNGDFDCDAVWSRIGTLVLRELFSTINQPVGSPLTTTRHGLLGGLYCDNTPCSSAQLIEILKVTPANKIINLK